MSSSKYDDLIKSLSGLNVALVDANNEYRSTYDILSDIASKWDSLSSMEQAALAETIAGTRQQAVFFSIIEQFQEASGAMDAMANSANVLEDAYGVYLDSTTAHINQFKAAFEELSATTFNSKFLSSMVDIGKTFVEFLNILTKTNTIWVALPIGIMIPKFVKYRAAVAATNVETAKLARSIINEGEVTEKLSVKIALLDAEQRKNIKTKLLEAVAIGKLDAAQYYHITAELENIAVNEELEASNFSLAASFKSVAAAIPGWGWALIAITGVIAVMGAVQTSIAEANEKLEESAKQSAENIDTLKEYKEKVDEISKTEGTEAEKLEELIKLKDELSQKYGIQTEEINEEAKAVENLTNKINDRINAERQAYLNQTQDKYDKAVAFATGNSSRMNLGNLWRGMETYGSFSLKTGNASQDLKKEKEGLKISKQIKDLFDEVPDNSIGTFTLGKNSKNIIEYFNTLKETYGAMGELIRNNSDATKDELALFEKVKKEYEMLYNDLKVGTDEDLTIFIPERSMKRAEEIMSSVERGTMSIEEWKEQMYEMAENDFVKDAIDSLVASLNDLNDVVEESPIDDILDQLTLLEGKLNTINEAIGKASDYLDDLVGVIDKNKETDKFFSADEMVDMLDKYPELVDNILVTAYGYKFEADALEELRKAKLEEQKTAIETQIAEAKGTKDNIEKELKSYSAKINGISTLAEAELALADVEDRLNNGNFKEGGYISNQLSEKRKNLQGAIDAWKRLQEADKNIKTATMQYTLLGNVFDDLKDKTNDSTKAMNDHKSALKDMTDDYKDAKDAIEDLVKLTMEMIKKNLNLEKENLKTQIENFKKIASKRKEYLDSLKKEKSFKDDLADQNRDLLKIQQELDALSVAGVEYSLEDMKRRSELEEQLAEKSKDREDFLFDHEIEVRKDAIDQETEAYTESLEVRIKELENMLDREGLIRQMAVDMINEKSEQFYNDLFNYTQTYTDKSKAEFEDLWNRAYDALIKYGNGQIDVDMTLAFLIGRIAQVENEMKILESQINSAKESADRFVDGFVDGMEDVNKVIAEDIEAMNTFANLANGVKAIASSTSKNVTAADMIAANFQHGAKANTAMMQMLKYIPLSGVKYEVHHSGGIAGGSALTKDSEILAKLLAGEVVVTTAQASNFMKSTLPKLAAATNISNQMSPTISIGDINIAGDADSTTVSQLKAIQKEIVNDVFKTINSQKNIFIGGKIR